MHQELGQKPHTFRMKQIDELILRSLSTIIREEVDIPDDVFFTITKVITLKDLAFAKIFYITLPEEKHAIVANIIKKNRKVINENLGENIIIRKIPKLKFIFDKEGLAAFKIDEKVHQLTKNL